MNTLRRAISVLGELLVTAGVIVLLFGAYELWGTGIYTAGQQNDLRAALDQSWGVAAPATPTPGQSSDGPSPSPGTSTAPPTKAPSTSG